MGRVRRQRRYKACDPFSNKKNKEDKFDLPPKRKDTADVHFEETKSFQYLQEKIDRAKSGKSKKQHEQQQIVVSQKELKPKNKKVAGKTTATTTTTSSLEQLPNETKKKYFQRLDRNVQEAINTAMIDTRTLRKKRKKHLQARDEKRKNKQKKNTYEGQAKEFSELKDNVKFGDVAKQPPTLIGPRKAPSKDKPYDLKLMTLLDGGKKKSTDAKKRKEMTAPERQNFDDERQKAIDAYRLIKKRKEMSRDIT